MKVPFINLEKQHQELKFEIEERVKKVFAHCQFIMGPEVLEFENQLKDYIGSKYAFTCASGTDGLLIALMAADVGPGDEVITTPFTFFATVEMIMLLGAKPVFVDVDEKTYLIDEKKIEKVITSKTKAIMPVSLYGQTCDMDLVNSIAKKHNLIVIEDAAQSFGADYKNKKSCNTSTIGVTSFFPAKPFGCYGDGGAVFTNDDDLAYKMNEVRNHGQKVRYFHQRVGINGRLDTLQCAIMLAKFDRFKKQEVLKRQERAEQYNKLLKPVSGKVTLPFTPSDRTNVYAQYTIAVDNREKLIKYLSDNGIPTSIHYPMPMYKQVALEHFKLNSADFPNTERVCSRVLSLPMSAYLTDEELAYVSSHVVKFFS